MAKLIALERVVGAVQPAALSGSAALELSSERPETLEFRFLETEVPAIEAIRHARRAMLREEWTLGRDPGEPSLEDAVFSPSGIVWSVPHAQREWCLRKMDELEARASRALVSLAVGRA
jgi:streptogramin lyase